MSAPAVTGAKPRRQSLLRRLSRDRTLLLMCLPGLLVLLIFHYAALAGNVIAWKDYKPYIGIADSDWVGWENFQLMTNGDPEFLNAVKNTLVLTLVQTVLVFPAPILLALLLNSVMSTKIKRIIQSVLYLPHFLSWVVVVAIFQQVLGGGGLINTWLRQNGHETLNIIGNPDLFVGLLTSQVMWKDTGWATILFLAALAGIDSTLYEASQVDGASRWRQLWHVTLPGLRGIIILLLILRLGDSLSVGFEQIILQQRAVGMDASEVIDTYVYNHGITGNAWGEATAVGLVKGLIGTILVLAANKVAHIFGEQGVYKS
ncbi:ABC transporter permease subunit [Aestuariimicrobium sp. p3-SID1156]|uniref:ABC transporter permease n=1 Tax=Aestuariimicrobium sp. p3-SID1156 TaxID=2916038 RepID=UPI00223C30FF|nr:ABC transporter permease subunit [Aestuariimicrobium sp. p3-SID1156]MCT1458826.1 ABC transporter permease subunit [Aestuariimicrobium sp. p3-SID1156]